MPRSRVTWSCLFVAIALMTWAPVTLYGQEVPKTDTHSAVAEAAHEMAHTASHFLVSLTPEQKAKAAFAFSHENRFDWHFIPRARQGLSWKEMTPSQAQLATSLLASGLSQRGFIKAETIMSLEEVLRDIEKGSGPVRDPELYFFSLFGNPDSADHQEPWGWRVEGHHLSLNFTIVEGRMVAAGPSFLGANPGEVRVGARKGLRVLEQEEDLARAFVKSLSDAQRSKAVVSQDAPKDILTTNLRKANPLEPAGLLASELTVPQAAELLKLIKVYSGRLRPELAALDMEKIFSAGIEKIGFAWAGPLEPGQPHYYRIQGPTFLIEYDNTQNNANHIHSVWRDFKNDFGEDLLRAHYEKHPHANGVHKH